MTPIRSLTALALALGLGCGASFATSSVSLRPEWRATVDAALEASGVDDPAERAAHAERLEAIVAEAAPRVLRARTATRRARRLHELVHVRWLQRYRPGADGLAAVLDRGEFNCVSATLFEGLLADALGLDARVVAGPRHVFLRFAIDGRDVDVESTAPTGFDVRRDPTRVLRFLRAYRLATDAEIATRGPWAAYDEYRGIEPPVPLAAAVAFVWHTRGERLLQEGRAEPAARAFLEVRRLHPDLARRSDTVQAGLARAFRIAYEAGRFDESFRIASIDLAVTPGRTTAQDRLLAAAVKRVQRDLDANDTAAAEATVDEVVAAAPEAAPRFEREACPAIAAAAVRIGDVERARRMAGRYGAVEPDTVEVRRLASWVERRLATAPPATARMDAEPGPDVGLVGTFKLQ